MASQEAVKRLTQRAEAFSAFAKKQLSKPFELKKRISAGTSFLKIPDAFGTSSIEVNNANKLVEAHIDGPRNISFPQADGMKVHTVEDFNALSVDHCANKQIEIAFGAGVNIDRHEIELNISSTGEMKSDFRIDISGENADARANLVSAFRGRGGEMYDPDAGDITNLIWDVDLQGYRLEETTENKIQQTKNRVILNEKIFFTRQQLLDIGYTHIPEEVIVADGAMELAYDINGKKTTITVPSEVPVDLEKSIFENHTIIPHEVVISE